MWQPVTRLLAVAALAMIWACGGEGSSSLPVSSGASSPLVRLKNTPVIEPRELFLVRTDGGSGALISRTAAWPKVEWSPDGESFTLVTDPPTIPGRVDVVVPDTLGSFDIQKGEFSRLNEIIGDPVSIPGDALEVTDAGLEYRAPDGRHRLLVANDPDWEVEDPQLSPSGRWATYQRYHSSSVWRQYDVSLSGEVRRLGDLPPKSYPSPRFDRVAVAAEKSSSEGRDLTLMNPDGSDAVTLAVKYATQMSWSPDGHRLIVQGPTRGDPNQATGYFVYVVNADGSGFRELPELVDNAGSVSWSPDGEWIAFQDHRGRLWTFDVDSGEATAVQPLGVGWSYGRTQWSTGSRKIAYTSNFALWLIRADGTDEIELADRCRDFWALSPVTDDVALTCNSSEDPSLRIRDGNTGETRGLIEPGNAAYEPGVPVWSPDGTRIAAFLGGGPEGRGVYVAAADGGEAGLLVEVTGEIKDIRWSDEDTVYLITDVTESCC